MIGWQFYRTHIHTFSDEERFSSIGVLAVSLDSFDIASGRRMFIASMTIVAVNFWIKQSIQRTFLLNYFPYFHWSWIRKWHTKTSLKMNSIRIGIERAQHTTHRMCECKMASQIQAHHQPYMIDNVTLFAYHLCKMHDDNTCTNNKKERCERVLKLIMFEINLMLFPECHSSIPIIVSVSQSVYHASFSTNFIWICEQKCIEVYQFQLHSMHRLHACIACCYCRRASCGKQWLSLLQIM